MPASCGVSADILMSSFTVSFSSFPAFLSWYAFNPAGILPSSVFSVFIVSVFTSKSLSLNVCSSSPTLNLSPFFIPAAFACCTAWANALPSSVGCSESIAGSMSAIFCPA